MPGRAYRRSEKAVVYEPTAALVMEIRSPGDETYRKFDFYFAHQVEELLFVDPIAHSVELFTRGAKGFVRADCSGLLGLNADNLQARIDWPD